MDSIETKTNQNNFQNDPNNKSKSTWTLLALTNILTALIIGSVFFFGNIPSNNEILIENALRQSYNDHVNAVRTEYQNALTQFSNAKSPFVDPFAPISVIDLNYQPRDYIKFTDGSVNYSITAVHYGSYKLQAVPVSFDSSVSYKVGQTVTAIDFKFSILNDTVTCAQLPTIRLLDAAGDQTGPNIKQFYFSDTGGCSSQANTTYSDLDVPFIVDPGQTEFTFSIEYQNSDYTPAVKLLKYKIDNNSIIQE